MKFHGVREIWRGERADRVIQERRPVFISLITLYLAFLGYGTLCLSDHSIAQFRYVETSDPSSPHRQGESKKSKDSTHSCPVAQHLPSTFFLVGALLFIPVLVPGRCCAEWAEKFHRTRHFSYTDRAPPLILSPD